jgi:hypothetical protein
MGLQPHDIDRHDAVIEIHPAAIDAIYGFDELAQQDKQLDGFVAELRGLTADLTAAFSKNQEKNCPIKVYAWVQDTMEQQRRLLDSIFAVLDLVAQKNASLGVASLPLAKNLEERPFLAARIKIQARLSNKIKRAVEEAIAIQAAWQGRLHGRTAAVMALEDDIQFKRLCEDMHQTSSQLAALWRQLSDAIEAQGGAVDRIAAHVTHLVDATVVSKCALTQAQILQKDIQRKKTLLWILAAFVLVLILAFAVLIAGIS